MRTVSVHRIDCATSELVAALEAENLPTEDLSATEGVFFAFEGEGQPIGFGGFELYGSDVLLRSVVVSSEARGKGYGCAIAEALLGRAREAGAPNSYLLTTTTEAFFEREGFARIERTKAPAAILATKQTVNCCPTYSTACP